MRTARAAWAERCTSVNYGMMGCEIMKLAL
jgi:hypothetical protein